MAATTTAVATVTTPALSLSAQVQPQSTGGHDGSGFLGSASSAAGTSSAVASAPPPDLPRAPLQTTLPSAETERQVAEARAAVVASMSNMVDTELQTRAGILHDNAAALAKQEKDVEAATAGLRREREKLQREADKAARKLKELGNVQNWAEVLERQFLVLEETMRLANDSASERGSSCSCSCSDCGARTAADDDEGEEEEVRRRPDGREEDDDFMRKHGDVIDNKAKHDTDEAASMVDMMAIDSSSVPTAWSDASRSLNEPESSTGTGMAKGSETASTSTNNE
jgi:hypothetical protein